MKKILVLAVAILATATVANAQIGIFGGFTSSNTSVDKSTVKDDFKNVSLFHAGVAYKAEVLPFLAIQPALAYQVKGARIENIDSAKGDDFQLKTGFIEASCGVQLGIDLVAVRPFALVEPFIGYGITGRETWDSTSKEATEASLKNIRNGLEYGFGLGAGVEFLDHVQLSVQWFKNLGNLYNGDELNKANVDVDQLKDVKNYQGIKITLGLFF